MTLDILLAVTLSAAALLCLGGMYAGVQIEKEARGFRIGGVE